MTHQWPAIERYQSLLSHLTPQSESDQLRCERHEAWLEAAIATAEETQTAKDVCEIWSDRAEELILKAWRLSGCDSRGYALLALGKLGARELNLSSDVDLILVRADEQDVDQKAIRAFQNYLTEYTEFGFCLRVDLTIRPGGKSASLIPTMSEFEFHYGYHGEMWERLAYVRMRMLAGAESLKTEIETFTKKFSFRKHLDFTLLEELKSLRSKIRSEKFETRENCFHLKLGPGGIRELELFVHAIQVIHGGRHPALRTFSTSRALEEIKKLKLLPEQDCQDLLDGYWHLRTLENKLHAYEDQQTYLVDLENGHPALPADFQNGLAEVTKRTIEIADSLFGQGFVSSQVSGTLDEQTEWLASLGFSKHSQTDTWPELLSATAVSRQSERDEDARLGFLKGFVTTLGESGVDRDLGLSLLLDFIRATRAKASFFTLLNRETRVRDDLARLFSISPYLGTILASRPELIDEFIFRRQAEPSNDFETLLEELAERRLLVELIAANQFLADGNLRALNENLSRTADGIANNLLSRLKIEYSAPDVSIVPMGKWGGRECGLKSDLDFVFTTPDEPNAEDHKLARRFLARMTEAHRGGSIYAIDMRLRPSGNAGPILVSEPRLKSYLEGSATDARAAAWERQAYLRARPNSTMSFNPAEVAAKRGLSQTDLDELQMIRSKLFVSAREGEIDLKISDGGLADVEFTAQIALLTRREFSIDPSTSGMIQYLEDVDASWKAVGSEIRERYEELRRVEQLFQLTTSQSGSRLKVRSDEFRRLASVMKVTSVELEAHIKSNLSALTACLDQVRSFARR